MSTVLRSCGSIPGSPPDASIVVPGFDDGEKLAPCLSALEAQSIRARLQVVVSLDGGSPLDGGLSSMTDLVVEGPHMGPAAARNRGWRLSSGRYILFTDSDCVPDPGWAEALLGTLESGADGVKGAYSQGGSRLIQRLAQVEFEERYRLLDRRGSTDLVDTYSAGFRRTALEAAGGFDESFPFPDHEDVDLSYRMKEMGLDLRFQPDALVSHTHRKSWNGYFRMKSSRGRWRMKVLRRFPGMYGGGDYTPRCMKLQILLVPMLLPAVALIPFLPGVAAVWLSAFMISTVPLVLSAVGNDPGVALLVPPFSFWRAVALFSGMVRGIFDARGGEA
jgi:GT2 family glycosyltransferase